jgi:CspA family cold shock protein
MTGTISFYNRVRGYGFAVPDDESNDIFVHCANLVDCRHLRPNDRISYDVGEYSGRPVAINVKLIEVAALPTDGGAQ